MFSPFPYDKPPVASKAIVTINRAGHSKLPAGGETYFAGRQDTSIRQQKKSNRSLMLAKIILPFTLGMGLTGDDLPAERQAATLPEKVTACHKKVPAAPTEGENVKHLANCLASMSSFSQKDEMGGAIAHELGHVIIRRQAAKTAGINPAREDGSKVIITIYQNNFSLAGILNRLNGTTADAELYSDEHYRPILQLWPKIWEARQTKNIYKPESKELRENVIRLFKESAIGAVAGAILEVYMHGGDGKSDHDQDHLKGIIRSIVLFTKPPEEWRSQQEVAEFSKKLKAEIYLEAHKRLQGFDPKALQAVCETLMAQAKAGKRQWTRGELEPLLQGLDS
jgi:hypothetical protein